MLYTRTLSDLLLEVLLRHSLGTHAGLNGKVLGLRFEPSTRSLLRLDREVCRR